MTQLCKKSTLLPCTRTEFCHYNPFHAAKRDISFRRSGPSDVELLRVWEGRWNKWCQAPNNIDRKHENCALEQEHKTPNYIIPFTLQLIFRYFSISPFSSWYLLYFTFSSSFILHLSFLASFLFPQLLSFPSFSFLRNFLIFAPFLGVVGDGRSKEYPKYSLGCISDYMHVCLSASKIWGRPSGFVKYYINVDTSSMHNNTV